MARPPPLHDRPRARPLGHAPRAGQQSLFCRHAEVDEEEKDAAKEIEREANAFAAALTMPAHLMRKYYDQWRHEPDCHARLCKLFASSGAAMGHRLHSVI